MEICHEADSEQSTEPLLPAAEFWKIFHTSVPALFNNEGDIVQKLGIIIQRCGEDYEYYTPPISVHRAEYEAKLPHYNAFTTWLVGQLVRALTLDKLACYHSQFVDWQCLILDVLATRNESMFLTIMLQYLAALKDLVEAKSSDGKLVFQWFSQSLHHLNSQPPLDQFELENSTKRASVITHLLKVVSSQTYMLAKCSPLSVEVYWNLLLCLLEDPHPADVVATLDSVSTSLANCGFLQLSWNCAAPVTAFKLCVNMDSVMFYVNWNYSGNCDSNQSVKPLLISFSEYFKTILENGDSISEIIQEKLYQTLVPSLTPKSPFLCSDCTSPNYCKLLAYLLKNVDSTENIQSKILPLLENASNFPAILLVVEFLIIDDLEKKLSSFQHNDRTSVEISAAIISNLWNCTFNVVVRTLEEMRRDQSVTTLQYSAKLLTAAFHMVSNISFHFKSIPIVFFGNKFYSAYNKLLPEIQQLNMISRPVITASKHLISLQESSAIDEREILKLAVLLSTPWLKHLTSPQLPGLNLASYLEVADQHIFPNGLDASVELECVEGLMRAVNEVCDTQEWRLNVLRIAKSNPETYSVVLRLLPVLLSTVIPQTKAQLVNHLVEPYFSSLNSSVVEQLSKQIPSVICAIAGSTEVCRSTTGEFNVVCKVCDSETTEKPYFILDTLEEVAVSLLEKYLQLQSNQSESVRKYVAASLKQWSNHIPESQFKKYVKKWFALMNDPHAEVRMTMAQMAGLLISERTEPAVVQLYNKVAMAIIHRSLSTANRDLQLSIITTVYNIACVPNDKVLNFTIRAFVLFLGHPSVMNHSVAQIYLKNIAAVRNKTVKDIFFRFQDEVFKVISELLIHNQLFNPKCVSATLLNLTQGLSFQTTKDFLDTSGPKYLLKYLLPLIIKKPKTTEILSVVAAMAGTELSSLLKDSFQYVYPHVNLFEDKKTLESVCKLIEQYTEYSLISLIRISFKVITCELLLYFHQEKRKVTEALLELRRIESDTPVEVIKPDGYPNTDSEVAQFIQPRFLGVLAYMDSILVSRSGCESGKRHALLTLPELIRLMGKVHITPVRFKVLATLRSALKLYGDSFPELVCFAWRAFVLNVSTLGPLLSTIVVSLLPLLDQHSVEISSVFHICIVDNLEAVSGYLAELYFLPDTPPIHQIYTLVQKELAKLRNLPVKDQLAVTLRMATHENADVRLLGLHKLRTELSLHRQHMVCLIRDHDNMDPFILKLLDALISGCKDPNEGVQLASAQCLGEIGAVDPGLLPNRVKMEVEEKEISFVINSEAFVIRALKEFVRAFQAATTTMDSYAFGIQELLKLYNVTKSDIWKQLSDSTKEIISPFRDSRYKPMQVKDTNIPHPIFGSTHGTGFKMWAVHWVSRLIPAVTDEFVRKVFSVCQLGLKNDLQTLLFFLPYIVLYAILGATKSQSVRIAEEMSTVLTWSDDQPATEGDTPLGSILTTGSSVQDLPVSQEKSLTHTLCAKTIYQLFDFLYRWLRETKQKIKPNEKSALSLQYDTLHEFLKKFSKLEISEGSFKCREYTRALLFLEEYITENPNTLQSYLPSLGIIYYHLHDPDSLRGIIAIHETEPTAQEMILFHEVTGKLQDAAACYEQLGQENVGGEDLYKAMVQCYLGMDQPLTALKLAQGLLNSGQCVNLVDLQAEAMLSLSQFPQLEQLLAGQDEGLGWGASLGQALLHLSQRRRDLMVATLNTMRQSLVRSLAGCSVSNSGYRHSYDVIVKLHIITELEKLGDMVLNMLDCQSVEQSSAVFARVVREELDNRLSVVQPACRVLQPVLCVRRVVLSLAQQMFTNTQPCRGIMPLFNTEIGNSWLKSIEIARKSGHFQQAYTNILTVEPYKPKGLFVEKAKLLWAKCEPEAALNTLQWGIEHHFPDATEFKTLPASERLDDRKLFAEAKLLMAVYNDENVNIDMETNVNNYRSAMEVCRNWEKSVVCFAQYKYKYLRTFSDNSEFLTKTLEYQVDIIYYFGKSLEYGCEYIYQSMPRMLSIWLDFGTQLAQDCISIPNRNTANLAERRATMDKMTTLIETFIERLPTYMFMTAFSQLISRICHPLKDCYKILRRVIIKIIIAYPQQALWMFLSVYKSPYTVRVKKCEDVLRSSEIQQEGALCQVISDFRDLFDKLIELGNKSNPEKGAAISIKSFLGSLYRLVSSPSFSKVVIPLQKFRTISLPRSTSSYHNPFPEDMVYISGMKEEVVVLASLQKPKKLTFIGTDGKQYPMMCKPNDDLRLDSRMMEFNSIVNMYLQRDAEARDRGLYIRTYSAVPLSDTSGLIEWVPNLVGLRVVITSIYKQTGIAMPARKYKEICCSRNDPLTKKREVFLMKLLPCHPPVLREWYLRQFSHPTSWYLARTSLVRTLSVMSIVGFMLGLGDRHGENILLDSTCGDIVHVDFNCLFNKGERFDWPERVPFRLTHNLVNAMGPTGVEGLYRHSCEITTRVMRQQIDQLMSVVRPFCYDPLVSWNTDKNARDENAEMTNEKALEDIQNIESRLQGIVRTRNRAQSIPLSVEGQVRTLIAEATNIDNLCQMYIGWGPYL